MDSGSDGDLIFVKEGNKLYIPYKERTAPQKWRTSNGTFTTNKVGKMEVIFPEFSESKVAEFEADVITVPKSAPPPVYDLIVGVKSLANIGAILDFANLWVTIAQQKLPMRPFDSLMDLKELRVQLKDHL